MTTQAPSTPTRSDRASAKARSARPVFGAGADSLNPAPLLLPALAVLWGISGGALAPERIPWIAAAASLLLLWLLLTWGADRAGSRRLSWAGRLAWTVLFWCLAAWRVTAMQDLSFVSQDRPVTVRGVVQSFGERTADGRERAWVRVDEVEQGEVRKRVEGDVLLSWPTRPDAPFEMELRVGLGFEARGYLIRRRATLNRDGERPPPWRLAIKSRRFFTVTEQPPVVWRLAAAARSEVSRLLDEVAASRGGPGVGLARALVLGDRTALSKDQMRLARVTGSVHLLAVSGLHLGLLAAFAFGITAPLWRGVRLAGAAVAMVGGWLLVGPEAAVSRALLMGLWMIGALALRRAPRPLNALAGSTALLLLWRPGRLGDLGFQLSVAATAALIVVLPVLARRWTAWLPRKRRRSSRLKVVLWSLAASVSAQLAAGPWLWPVTALAHPWAPLLDLLAVPWLSLVLAAAWGAVAWGLVLQVAGGSEWSSWLRDGPFAWIDGLCLPAVTLYGALFEAGLPWRPALPLAVDGVWAWLLGALLLTGLSVGRRTALVTAVFILGAPFWGPSLSAPASPAELLGAGSDEYQVIFLDVGQGDATLLISPSAAVLVDGGGRRHGDIAAWVLVPALARLGVRRLDAVVMTHDDTDHCAGLVDLSFYIPVGELWSAPGWSGACADELRRRIPRFLPLSRGMSRRLAGWDVDVLWPPMGLGRSGNDASLVLRASAAGRSVWLTGDLEAAGERVLARELVGESPDSASRVDILKVAHHGSKTSTTEPFVAVLDLRWAVISAGRGNRYGHPHPTVTERLRRHGATTLRTDRHGQVRFAWTVDAPLRVNLPAGPE